MGTKKCGSLAALIVAYISVTAGEAQTTGTGADYLKQSLTGGFVYELEVGPNPGLIYPLNNAPGFAINYSYRPRRWFALETGFEQILRPVGSSVCCRYLNNANDELYLVPFGVRYVWEAEGGRVRLSMGGGGAYVIYKVGQEAASSFVYSFSGWGGQFVVSGDYGLTRSGKFRVGFAGRYYYASPKVSLPTGMYPPGYSASAPLHLLVGGPVFTFSFH